MKNVSLTGIRKARLSDRENRILQMAGIKLDQWQVWLLSLMLVLSSLGFSIPRQNGKTYVLIAFCVISVLRGKRILYTSHRQDVAIEMGTSVVKCLRRKKLAPAVVDWHVSKYYVDISTTSGGMFLAKTRSEATGRSQAFDIVIYDEAQFATERHVSAIQFTQFTGVQPITIMCGTPLEAEDMQDCMQRPFWKAHLRDDFIEWSAGEYSQSININDKRLLKRVNPGIERSSEEAIRTERETLSHIKYCQERLGCWMPAPDEGDVLGEPVLTSEQVEGILTKSPAPDGRYELSVAMDDFHDKAVFSANQNGRLEVVAEFERDELSLMVEWLRMRKNNFSKIWLKKSAYAESLKLLCAGHKLLYKSIEILPEPLMSVRYQKFVAECLAGSIRIYDTPDVRSSLLTFWAMETKRGYTILRGGKEDWEMIIQSLALHNAHYTVPAVPITGAERKQQKQRSFVF